MRTNIDIVRLGYEAFGSQDPARVLEHIDADIEWYVPDELPYGGSYHGIDGVAKLQGGLGGHYEKFAVIIESYHDAGDTVVVQGRHQGQVRGGDEFDSGFAAFFTFRDGKVSKVREYVDASKVFAFRAVTSPR